MTRALDPIVLPPLPHDPRSPAVLSERHTAALLNLSLPHLRRLRRLGHAPRHVKLSGVVSATASARSTNGSRAGRLPEILPASRVLPDLKLGRKHGVPAEASAFNTNEATHIVGTDVRRLVLSLIKLLGDLQHPSWNASAGRRVLEEETDDLTGGHLRAKCLAETVRLVARS